MVTAPLPVTPGRQHFSKTLLVIGVKPNQPTICVLSLSLSLVNNINNIVCIYSRNLSQHVSSNVDWLNFPKATMCKQPSSYISPVLETYIFTFCAIKIRHISHRFLSFNFRKMMLYCFIVI